MTPWGKSDQVEKLAVGIKFYSTPSHGGFKINKKQLLNMPKHLQNADGWYEEDCESLKVILAFPHLFSEKQRENVQARFDRWFNPDGSNRHIEGVIYPEAQNETT